MKRLMIINGPNLNLLGYRDPEKYGSTTLSELYSILTKKARLLKIKPDFFQSNHEGCIIDKIHSLIGKNYIGLIINPGAFTHYSYAILDAIEASRIKTIEVHITDIEQRDEFRKISVIKDVCIQQIKGLGIDGYMKAIEISGGFQQTER